MFPAVNYSPFPPIELFLSEITIPSHRGTIYHLQHPTSSRLENVSLPSHTVKVIFSDGYLPSLPVNGIPYKVYDGRCISHCHTPLGRFSKHGCSTTKEGANIIQNGTCSESSLSARCFQRRPFLAPALLQLLWRYRPQEIGPGGCDIHGRIRQSTENYDPFPSRKHLSHG